MAIVAIAPLTAKPSFAADHTNLEEGLPTEVEDAYPIPYGGLELQTLLRYDRFDGNEGSFRIEPRLEYGFAPNWQTRLTLPLNLGSAEDDDFGDIGVEVFYNFNAESLSLPAFAVSLSADFPTGNDSQGVDPTLKFIATKTLGAGTGFDRLHLNLAYSLNDRPLDGERDDSWQAILGYSRRLSPETIFVADVVAEQEKDEGEEMYLLEAGIRHQVNPLTVLSIGGGAGLAEDSPDFRIVFGWQQSF